MPLDAQYSFILVAAIVSATYFGLLALWAAARHDRGLHAGASRHWLWHIAPLVLSLAALVRMGGPDPFAIFFSQALVVGVYLATSRVLAWSWNTLTRRASGTESRRWRFTLRDGVLAILLAAVALAIARDVPPEGESGHMLPGWRLTVTGLGLGAVTCAAFLVVAGPLRWYWRIFPTALLMAAGAWLVGIGNFKEAVVQFIYAPSVIPAADEWAVLLPAGQFILSFAWLLLIRMAGWGWWTPARKMPVATSAAVPRWMRTRRLAVAISRIVLIASSAVSLCYLAALYWALLPPTAFPEVVLPSPNGADDLAMIDKKIDWTLIPTNDPDDVSDLVCGQFIETNAEPLRLLRACMEKPWMLKIDYFNYDGSWNHFEPFRNCFRLLLADARYQSALGRHDLAVQDYLDVVRWSLVSGTGGLLIDDLLGTAYSQAGLVPLANELDTFDKPSQREIVFHLELLDGPREPLAALIERDDLLDLAYAGWVGRLMFHAERFATGGIDPFHETAIRCHNRDDAMRRLLMTEAALRLFRSEHRRWPASLNELVPDLLSKVPTDPFSDRPIVYRCTDDRYLLYSVGANGVDDGGQRSTLFGAVQEQTGDLFFDASNVVY